MVDAAETFEVHVCGLAGPLCDVIVDATWTVRDLRDAVSAATGLAMESQQLWAGPTLLLDGAYDLTAVFAEGIDEILCVTDTQPWCELDGLPNTYVGYLRGGHVDGFTDMSIAEAKQHAQDAVLGCEQSTLVCEGKDVVGFVALCSASESVSFLHRGMLEPFPPLDKRLQTGSPEQRTYVYLDDSDGFGRSFVHRSIMGRWTLISTVKRLDVIVDAVAEEPAVYRYVVDELRCNLKVAQIVVPPHPELLRFAPEEICADREIVLAAVMTRGDILRYASPSLQADDGIVLSAVRQDGLALQFACEAFKSDQAIVLDAVHQNGFAIKFAHDSLRSDPVVALEAVKQNGLALKFTQTNIRENRDIVTVALQQRQAEDVQGQQHMRLKYWAQTMQRFARECGGVVPDALTELVSRRTESVP